MSLAKDFKAFIMRGSVVDMAVGIVIGAAFGKIVSSLVADVIMPPIGYLLSGVDFTGIKLTLRGADIDAAGKVVQPAVTLNVGTFVQTCVDFVIVAAAIFLVIQMIGRLRRKEAAAPAPAAPPEPPADVKLLTEIRDLLKK